MEKPRWEFRFRPGEIEKEKTMPNKTFDEALGDLLADYADADPDELISALEIQLYALRESVED